MKSREKHTVVDPIAAVENLTLADEARIQLVAELFNDLVHVRLELGHGGGRIVLSDGATFSGMLGWVGLAEQVQHNLAIH